MSVDVGINHFLEKLRSDVIEAGIAEARDSDEVAAVSFREQAFTSVMLSFLEDHAQISDPEICYVERRFGRGIGKMNGWHWDPESGIATIVTTVFRGLGDPLPITATELVQTVERAVRALGSAIGGAHREMEPATPSYDAFETFYSNRDNIDLVKVLVLGDGYAADLGNHSFEREGFEVQVDIWDIRRSYRVDASGLPYEPIEIDIRERNGTGIPCIFLSEAGKRDFDTVLTIFPGDLLHQLYHDFGPRILELNVRSFLQARGKVNRGIRDTLKNEPERFIAYNNGISATAESIDVASTPEGEVITGLRGLQIVNGGQTVASIHRAKARDGLDLSDVYVQAKITRVGAEQIDALVPRISRYANTQNSVGEADFSANHPFHVRFQQLSETVWAPGEQSKWFYERARGQYEVAMQREGTTPARKRRFQETNPKSQTLDKVKLARYINSWDQLPHIVSRGGQKNFAAFMQRLSKNRAESWEPDVHYFKEAVAQAIIYKQAEKSARRHGFPGYRANAITYTIGLLSYRTAGRIPLITIWNRQAVTSAMETTIHTWMPTVFEALIDSSGDRNVTEWCKKEECWRHLQTLDLRLPQELVDELASGQALPTVGNSNERSADALSEDDRENIARVMQVGPETWVHIVGWGYATGELAPIQRGIATTLASYSAANWSKVPSKRQAAQGVTILKIAEEGGGMPGSDD